MQKCTLRVNPLETASKQTSDMDNNILDIITKLSSFCKQKKSLP